MGFGGMSFCGSSRFHVVNDGAPCRDSIRGGGWDASVCGWLRAFVESATYGGFTTVCVTVAAFRILILCGSGF